MKYILLATCVAFAVATSMTVSAGSPGGCIQNCAKGAAICKAHAKTPEQLHQCSVRQASCVKNCKAGK